MNLSGFGKPSLGLIKSQNKLLTAPLGHKIVEDAEAAPREHRPVGLGCRCSDESDSCGGKACFEACVETRSNVAALWGGALLNGREERGDAEPDITAT